jgi:GntR family transcriptional regulator
LSRQLGTPLHHQIFLIMRDQISSGRYRTTEPLPTEDELTRLFGVSRITVRTALGKLATSGLIEHQQGGGTFVKESASKPIRVGIRDQRALLEQLGETTSLKLLEVDYGRAPADVQSWFGCEPEARFVRVVRMRTATKPVLLYFTFIPEQIGRSFSRHDYACLPHRELIRRAGIQVTSAQQVISASLADPAVAGRLKIDVGAAVLKIRTMFFAKRLRPVRYLEVLADPTMFELHMTFGPHDWIAKTRMRQGANWRSSLPYTAL